MADFGIGEGIALAATLATVGTAAYTIANQPKVPTVPAPPSVPNPSAELGAQAAITQRQRALAGAGFAGVLDNQGGGSGLPGGTKTTSTTLLGG